MHDRKRVARTLEEIARYLDIDEANRFKALAYRKAARTIEKLPMEMDEFIRSGTIERTSGIGRAIGPAIIEIARSGRSSTLEELRASYPSGIFDLLRVPGLGIRKIEQLRRELAIETVDDLETAAAEGRLRALRGFGPKTDEKIAAAIAQIRASASKHLLVRALELSLELQEALAPFDEIIDVVETGAIRRRLEVVESVDLCIVADDPDVIAARLDALPMLDDVSAAGGVVSASARGIALRLIVVDRTRFAPVLFWSTGSEPFVDEAAATARRRRLDLRPDGLYSRGKRQKVATEEALFEKIGWRYVEPELREPENRAIGLRKRRPALVTSDAIRGIFHVHTTWSDGADSLEEMLQAARERQFEYVGISDHSRSAAYAGGLTEEMIEQQRLEIEGLRDGVRPMRVFHGTEADILIDGKIDYGADVLRSFDFVIASIHSRFRMERDEMTERIVRALQNPFVTFLGHLTGRLLLSRSGYQIDFNAVCDAAAENGVMIEINADPRRLEPDWRTLRSARDRGVVFSIHPDAHSTGGYANVIPGTWMARKGGLSPAEIFNTRPLDEIEELLEKRRARAASLLPGRGTEPGDVV